jgi:DNA gyrase subunit A
MRYPLVDGQGNFGSVDGDNAGGDALHRSAHGASIAHELLADIDKETVDFVPNYDGSEHEPSVLPTRFPNLLINGASGIAVGMATNIPPHNLDRSGGCVPGAAQGSRDTTWLELMQASCRRPDFPTAGIIYGTTRSNSTAL